MSVHGVVAVFNEHRGDGVIRDRTGNSFYFHCVELLDGTRTINPGTKVRGQRRVGHLGCDELGEVEVDA